MGLRMTHTHPIPHAAPKPVRCVVPRLVPQPSHKRNWCWAACAEMVLAAASIFRHQADIASDVFSPTDCRQPSADQACDQQLCDLRITQLLDAEGLVTPSYFGNQIVLNVLKAEISAGRPVLLGATYTGSNTGHVVVACGLDEIDPADPVVVLCDPMRNARGHVRWLRLQQEIRQGLVWDATWTNLGRE